MAVGELVFRIAGRAIRSDTILRESDTPGTPETAPPRPAAAMLAAGLSFAWGGRVVFEGVDLRLERGQITALLGANGAGKTTLIRILAGGLQPQAGDVRIGDVSVAADRRAYLQRLGTAVAGDRGVYARLDVRGNLALAAGLALQPRRRRRELVEAAIERFGLEPLATRRGDRLSLGQRQRVRLAIAFLHEPQVVLLDEPSSSLDEQGSELLARALQELTARGGSALWASPIGWKPDLPLDRTVVLEGGRLT